VLRVGLTGGIACGKSHVLARLAEAGCRTIDLDRLAHELMAPGQPAHAEIVASFGTGVLGPDGTIDRKRLGAVVFADVAARQRLNAIVHPRVRAEEARRAVTWSDQPGAVVVTDAALLVESGVHLRFDRLVVVHCSREAQLERLMRRDGIGGDEALARIAAQMPLAEKRRFAHIEVETSGSHRDTDGAALRLAEQLETIAASRPPRAPVPLERALGCLAMGPSHGPGGLAIPDLLGLIVSCGGVEMAAVARAMGRDPRRPWYEPEPSPAHPAAFAGPLVLYALARAGADHDFVASAGASLARLVERDGPIVSETCLFALALTDLGTGRPLAELPAIVSAHRPLAARWGGGDPTRRLEPVFEAARDPSRAVATDDTFAPLAGALRGMAQGTEPGLADPGLVAALEALEGPR
jgi:dephospho-CoA kinase